LCWVILRSGLVNSLPDWPQISILLVLTSTWPVFLLELQVGITILPSFPVYHVVSGGVFFFTGGVL
jgi:hypothetical protein